MISLPRGAKRLIMLGSPCRLAGASTVSLIERWLSSSGPEWTTVRLKSIREGAYQLRAGNTHLARKIWQENSIAYDKRTLIPKGVMGVIVLGYVSARKPTIIRKYDALLRVYTCIRVTQLTDKQYSKARNSILSPFKGDDDFVTKMSSNLEVFSRKLLRHFRNPIGEDGKVVIDLSKLSPTSGTHVCLEGGNPLSKKSWGKHTASIWTSVYLPESLKTLNPAEKLRSCLARSGAESSTAGHLSVIQEGGCKGRVVAVPNAWEQVLFRPLAIALRDLADRILTSCVSNQNGGAYFLRDAFLSGKKVYSIDLSSATDRFPLKLQLAVLRGLGCPQYAEALEEISNAPWISPRGETWSYSVGQPMGLYGSFQLFHLTHLLLLGLLQRKLGGDYRVLGDDVVITGEDLAKGYTKCLEKFGVERSVGKTIASHELGEFAGFVCTKTNQTVAVHRPFKWSGSDGFGSPLSLLNSFGREVRKFQNSKWADWYEIFIHTKAWRNPDLSPLFNTEDDDSDIPVVNLNSHLLGSMGNRLNYYLDYVPSEELQEFYEEQQIILLGQKEVVKDGFSSAESNALLATGVKNSEANNLSKQQVAQSYSATLSTDPLMRQFKHAMEAKTEGEVSKSMEIF